MGKSGHPGWTTRGQPTFFPVQIQSLSSERPVTAPFQDLDRERLATKAFDTHSGKQYSIALLDPSGRTKKVEVKCYGNIMGAYREHPEAKFLGPDGKPCNSLTRGLLSRSHIVATRHRYIGKETSRRWEQGDDLSLVDFRCAEYVDGKIKADAATRKRIVEIGIRKVARETGINRETVALVANDGTVKPRTMRKIADFLAKRVN